MTAKLILNPYANRWKAKARLPEAESALKSAGVDFDLVISERPGHLIELAKQAARQGFSPIIAAGGDGTIGEVVNGLAHAVKSEKDLLGPLGILPLGSANDLVDNLGLPTDLTEAARVIAAGKTRLMDLGYVNGFYFANNSAIGSGTIHHPSRAAHHLDQRNDPLPGGGGAWHQGQSAVDGENRMGRWRLRGPGPACYGR